MLVPLVQTKDIEIEISGVKEELSELKSKLKKVELQLDTGTDAKGAPLSPHDRQRFEKQEESLNSQLTDLINQLAALINQRAGLQKLKNLLQEEKNLLLKKQMGMLSPQSTSPVCTCLWHAYAST